MTERKPELSKKAVGAVVGHLSRHASCAVGSQFYTLSSIRLCTYDRVWQDRKSDVIAEFWDFRNLDQCKRDICAFMATRAYVRCVVIEYTYDGGFWPLQRVSSLTMTDGYSLPVDLKWRHVGYIHSVPQGGSFTHMADVHNLIWNDKLDELQALVPTHVHINQGFDGKTMLHEAVLRRNTRIVEWLVRQPGIQIDAVDRYGASPFMCAARLLSVDMMRVLHHHGASTDTADRWGLNAFHEVARAATKRDLDTFYACITLMRTCVPLCVTTEAWTYVMSVANPDDATPEIKRAFHLLGQYIHDEMTLLVQAWCPIRVLADLIMQYWLEDYSIFNP